MLEPQKIDEFVKKLTAMMPPSLGQFHDEIEKNLKSGMQNTLHKLDLVTREEYEVQTALLARTREKLVLLEAKLRQLEENLKP